MNSRHPRFCVFYLRLVARIMVPLPLPHVILLTLQYCILLPRVCAGYPRSEGVCHQNALFCLL